MSLVEYLAMLPVTLVVIIILGYFGYFIFRSLHIPAPALAGAIVTVGLLSGLGVPFAATPSFVKAGFQSVIGIMIGFRFSRDRIKGLRTLLVPGLVVTAWMVGAGLAIGFLLERLTSLDIGTALFSAVPGGLAEMSSFAFAYGLNVPAVVVLQFVRLVGIYLIVPTLVGLFGHKTKSGAGRELSSAGDKKEKKGPMVLWGIALTLFVGSGAGFTALYLGIPAGGLLGAMVVIGTLSALGLRLEPLPKKFISFAQVGLGAVIGLTFTPAVMSTLGEMVLPVILVSIFMTVSGALLGYIMHLLFHWDLTTALLACAPAGASQMSAIALDMDADALTVGVIQAMRLPAILLILPPIIKLLIQ